MECPNTHRVWLTLLEKDIAFTFHHIPLKHPTECRLLRPEEKPPAFLRISPAAKVRSDPAPVPRLARAPMSAGRSCHPWAQVELHRCLSNLHVFICMLVLQSIAARLHAQMPVLVHQGAALFESAIICEYLDDAFPSQHRLMPARALQRAKTRVALDMCCNKLGPLFVHMFAAPDQAAATWRQMHELLIALDAMLRAESAEGPFWFGATLTLADIVYFPLLDRCARAGTAMMSWLQDAGAAADVWGGGPGAGRDAPCACVVLRDVRAARLPGHVSVRQGPGRAHGGKMYPVSHQ